MSSGNEATSLALDDRPVDKEGQRLAAIVESAFDAIIAKTLDGEITSWNRAAEQLYGFTAGEAIGQPVSIIVPDDKRAELDEIFKALRRGDWIAPFETRRTAKDGRRLTVSLTVSPIMDEAGAVVGASAISRDITRQRRVEMCQATSRAIARLLADELSFPQTSRAILEQVTANLDCEHGELWIHDDARDLLIRAESVVLDPKDALLRFDRERSGLEWAVAEGLPGRVWRSGRAACVEDIAADAAFSGDVPAQTAGIRSALAFPIDSGDRFHGVMSFFTTQRVASDESLLILMTSLGVEIGAYIRHIKITAENANLAAIIESSNDAIIGWTTEGVITSWNPQAERIFGHPATKMIGASVFEIIPADQVRRARRVYRKLMRSGREDTLGEISLNREGQDIRLSLTFSPIKDHDGALIGFSTIARDVTAQRKVEAELRRAKQSAERANRAKSEFLATMSHEIRTSLHGVLSTADLLNATRLTPEQRDYLEILRDSGEQLLHLLNDLLDLSKIEAGCLEFKQRSFNPRELFGNLTSPWKSTAHAKGLEFFADLATGLPDRLIGDDHRLRQVLENLISNAVKYTDHGHVAVRVSMDPAPEGQCRLRFEVKDTGLGITPSFQKRLFTRFQRGEGSSETGTDGNGLGLAICKQIVDRMGGSIGVDSKPNQGSTFWFTAPMGVVASAKKRPSLSEGGAPGLDAAASPLRILVADDNATNRKLLTDILSMAGHAVDIARDGVEAVEAARRTGYDLIFMDMRMPDLDGVAAAREIRSLVPGGDTLPIVAVTANAMRGDRERYLAAGLTDYLAKPFSIRNVLGTVNKAAASAKAPAPN